MCEYIYQNQIVFIDEFYYRKTQMKCGNFSCYCQEYACFVQLQELVDPVLNYTYSQVEGQFFTYFSFQYKFASGNYFVNETAFKRQMEFY